MKKVVFLCLIMLLCEIVLAATDGGFGHVGSRRSKRYHSNVDFGGGWKSAPTKKSEEKKDDAYYAEQYKRTLLTEEERNFAKKNHIPIGETERIRDEFKKHKQKQITRNSILRIETPKEEPSVAWEFIYSGREEGSSKRKCVVKYFVPEGEKNVTASNIIFSFENRLLSPITTYQVQGKENIVKFSKTLSDLTSKMAEWKNVAQRNKVKQFEKNYDDIVFYVNSLGIPVELKAKFNVVEENDKIQYRTTFFRLEDGYEFPIISFDEIGLVNFTRASQLDKALPILKKKIEQIVNTSNLFK